MELTIGTIIILALVFAAGAFLGVLLGRRSKTTNAYVDKIRDGFEREREEFRQQIRQLQDKAKSRE